MATTDPRQTTQTDMQNVVTDYSVDPQSLDTATTTETFWNNPNWSEYLGYYKSIPELKEAIRTLARWSVGLGYVTDTATQVLLDNITGWGEDTFQSIITNMIIVKKVNGDAYAEIIRNDNGTLINLKPLDPASMKTIVNKKGLITGYEELNAGNKNRKRTFQPQDIFHIVNDRTANEIHGVSVIEACKWVIDARNEAMEDKRRVHHRSTIRVMEVDSDDPNTLKTVRAQYAEAIKSGEVLIVPKDNVSFPNAPITYIDTLEWIRYLENFFYVAVGVPKPIVSVEGSTEAASKVGFMTFDPTYSEEQALIEQDLWNQIAIKLKFRRPPSLNNTLAEDEAKNTGQTSFQPNEAQVSATRTE